MALREIIKNQASEVLRKKAGDVNKIDVKISALLEDMSETLLNAGGDGLAAPQVGVSLRLVVIKSDMSIIKLVNPVIVKAAGEQISPEGCLSLPGVYGKVRRPEFVLIQALGQNGKPVEIKAKNRLAAALAHEIDHLDGILLIDKAFQVVTYRR
jgi:peptide deformylase